MSKTDIDALAADLADFTPKKKVEKRSARDERIIAGFEDIERFYEEHERLPQHGAENDIFERMYAVRLERLRDQEDCRSLLLPIDKYGLLKNPKPQRRGFEENDIDSLAESLKEMAAGSDITELKHVRSITERQAAEEIANRNKCADFAAFKPLFDAVLTDLEIGVRITRRIRRDAGFLKTDIREGEFFIVGGQTAYIAEVGEPIKAPNGEHDARLRVIYSNGTESDLLLRSMQRALYKDEESRRITDPSAGPLFSDQEAEDDIASGTVYVLQSMSDHPFVQEHREIVHKIGVTGGTVERRIANAEKEATYLLAGVKVVATYKLFNINKTRFEAMIHRVFAGARLDIEITDRFGSPVVPREWFVVPIFVIDEVIERIKDGTISNYVYDQSSATLKQATR